MATQGFEPRRLPTMSGGRKPVSGHILVGQERSGGCSRLCRRALSRGPALGWTRISFDVSEQFLFLFRGLTTANFVQISHQQRTFSRAALRAARSIQLYAHTYIRIHRTHTYTPSPLGTAAHSAPPPSQNRAHRVDHASDLQPGAPDATKCG